MDKEVILIVPKDHLEALHEVLVMLERTEAKEDKTLTRSLANLCYLRTTLGKPVSLIEINGLIETIHAYCTENFELCIDELLTIIEEIQYQARTAGMISGVGSTYV